MQQSNNKHDFQLQLRKQNIPDEKLLDDLRRVALEHGQGKVTQPLYKKYGKYSFTTPHRRFGSWNEALKRANLSINNELRISDIRLFENIENVWIRLGKQPRRRDMIKPISVFSEGPYNNRFGSWNKALQAFMDYINEVGVSSDSSRKQQDDKTMHRTNRDVDLRLRFRVMRRDMFKCKNCGRSPATDPEVVLHIDHILAWSKGGETEIGNLQTLCSKCNLGKGTLEQTE
jgi:5-methylcytosine-specific restriction endonuclease McrA